MKKATTTNEKFIEIDGKIKLLHQKIHIIETNHLKHMKRDIDRILYVLGAVGLVVLGELFVLLNAVLK